MNSRHQNELGVNPALCLLVAVNPVYVTINDTARSNFSHTKVKQSNIDCCCYCFYVGTASWQGIRILLIAFPAYGHITLKGLSTYNIEIRGEQHRGQEAILTPSALKFLVGLHKEFGYRRKVLLRYRSIQQARVESGELPNFPDHQFSIRHLPWSVAPVPGEIEDRRTELAGPVDRKTLVKGLSCGANVFVADFEDATSPTWRNCIRGHINLADAVHDEVWYMKKEGGIQKMKDHKTVLEVRPRGLHQVEKHLIIDGEPIAASFFDFGLFLFHNAIPLLEKGSRPYFSLPKLENSKEAKLWRDIIDYSQNKLLHLSLEDIKVKVCVETLPAVFELDEIIYQLRDHITSLQAGRWNYLFSLIKNFRRYQRFILPDLELIDFSVPFMQAYNQLIIKLGHRRDVHTIGSMTVVLPEEGSKDYEKALGKAREYSAMEARQGFDGTQVADPKLIPVVREEFGKIIGDNPHQKDMQMENITVSRLDLLHTYLLDRGTITEKSFRHHIDVLILYIVSWLKGKGIVRFDERMENAATAEIYRTQMWQWSHEPGVTLDDGRAITTDLCKQLLDEEKERILKRFKELDINSEDFNKATQFITNIVKNDEFEPYMTLAAYDLIE